MKTAIQLITEERERQIVKEGWTSEHDDQHVNGELSAAAASYSDAATFQTRCGETDVARVKENTIEFWPFGEDDFKVSPDPVRNLVKAGALIVAEIERLQRT